MKKLLIIAMSSLILSNCYGCIALMAGAAGGAGSAVWLSGKLVQQVSSSYETTINATRAALKAMNLEITKETKAADVTQVRSVYADGRKVWIDIHPISSNSTRIEIRVGAFSDKTASDEVLKKIISYL